MGIFGGKKRGKLTKKELKLLNKEIKQTREIEKLLKNMTLPTKRIHDDIEMVIRNLNKNMKRLVEAEREVKQRGKTSPKLTKSIVGSSRTVESQVSEIVHNAKTIEKAARKIEKLIKKEEKEEKKEQKLERK